jgi:hypothetical protein
MNREKIFCVAVKSKLKKLRDIQKKICCTQKFRAISVFNKFYPTNFSYAGITQMVFNHGLFLFYYVFYAACCVYLVGLDSVFANLDATLSFLGQSDGGTYIRCAQDIINGKNSFLESWMLDLWPPGMLVLSVGYMRMFLNLMPIGVYYTLLISFIYSVLSIKLHGCFKMHSAACWPAVLCSIALFFFVDTWKFIYYSDAFFNGTFACGVVLLFLAFGNGERKNYILSGVFFTFSCFFRSHCFLALIPVPIIWLLLYAAINRNRRDASIKSAVFNSIKYTFSIIMLCVFAYHLISKGKYCYNKADYLWTLPFITPTNKCFIYDGGMAAAGDCDIHRKKVIADEINLNRHSIKKLRTIVILSPLKYPMYYLKYKVPIGWKYFCLTGNFLTNWLVVLFFSFAVFALASGIGIYAASDLFLFSVTVSSFLSAFVPSLILHFEARYFILFKVVALLCLILYLIKNYEKFIDKIFSKN